MMSRRLLHLAGVSATGSAWLRPVSRELGRKTHYAEFTNDKGVSGGTNLDAEKARSQNSCSARFIAALIRRVGEQEFAQASR